MPSIISEPYALLGPYSCSPFSAEQMSELVRLVGLGTLKPVVSCVYSLDQAPRALEDMGARKVVGKVVIDTRLEGRGDGGNGYGSSGRGTESLVAVSRL